VATQDAEGLELEFDSVRQLPSGVAAVATKTMSGGMPLINWVQVRQY
jgi:hypothetical protein